MLICHAHATTEDLPWIDSMAPSTIAQDHGHPDSQPPTVAAFTPSTIAGSALTSRQRSSIIVHRKSPLLVATPPSITRALAYSHPFLLPLNKFVGLITWTTGDPWQSFLLVATFWAVVLYSDAIILWAGPILVVVGLILGMYGRRYSPLSSTITTGEKHQRSPSADSTTRHQKSLDDIVETLRTLTTRCNILLEPLLDLTDFLSTQRTATSATTRPALTALFVRILLVTPVWIALTLPPFYLITTRRIIITVGTVVLTYHSRPARVSRVILWRSRLVRRLCAIVTGLSITEPPSNSQKSQAQGMGINISTKRRKDSGGVRFTFVVYENQRRWLGIGWTYSLFPSERSAWTDEHLNPVPAKDSFELPDVRTGDAKWRWVTGTEWRVEGADTTSKSETKAASEGWIYYDNKWNDGRRGQDGWDRYTRRRKWFRDAELVDVDKDGQNTSEETITNLAHALEQETQDGEQGDSGKEVDADRISLSSSTPLKNRRRRWFSGKEKDSAGSDGSPDAGRSTGANTEGTVSSRSASSRPISIQGSRRSHAREGSVATTDSSSLREEQDHLDRWATRAADGTERAEREFGLSDEVNMGLS
ncbi:peroxisomal membrane protein Pex23-Penicillium chrysogenum [Penicillium longicatenatum]|uniref:peroxisomal membrane protein Pex23-Penicillium chrysogenum n=1 Tax=Penicillium longicatenatum TaxID=1561947 RepID=UPI002548FAFC|nr:peroxisomal membrane protein Pex23-Penicillium chrysogenum [Penicillium longicatenatum]KAJ5658315.1 peroxisomal membrane protein Pex23-Penicillium chrysogenum [Penicillium longicatenatum]